MTLTQRQTQPAAECGTMRMTEMKTATINNLDCVAIQYRGSLSHEFTVREAIKISGKLQIGGCLPSSGMTGKILSQPYRNVGGDLWTMRDGDTVAVLADGTEVKLAAGSDQKNVKTYTANGTEYRTVIDAAISITPAN